MGFEGWGAARGVNSCAVEGGVEKEGTRVHRLVRCQNGLLGCFRWLYSDRNGKSRHIYTNSHQEASRKEKWQCQVLAFF